MKIDSFVLQGYPPDIVLASDSFGKGAEKIKTAGETKKSITEENRISAQLSEHLIIFWPRAEMVEERFVVVGDGKIVKIIVDKPNTLFSNKGSGTVKVVIRFKQMKDVGFIVLKVRQPDQVDSPFLTNCTNSCELIRC
jgi:hypothetical protein